MKLIFAFATALIATSALAGAFPSVSDGTSVSTTPHYQQESFTVHPNSNTPDIPVPTTNAPVQMIVSDNTFDNRGIGQATILHPAGTSFVEWIGLDVATNNDNGNDTINNGAAAIVSEGYSHAAGQHIVWADFSGEVDVQVASRTAVRIHNVANKAQKVVITFIW